MTSINLIAPLEIAKVVAFVAYVASTIGVIVGVYWEGDQFPTERQQLGWRVLVASLAFDTFFTIIIFGVDGWINVIQRGEIITLETRLAARTLSDTQAADIKNRAAQFQSQTFQVITYWDDDECMEIANRVADMLIAAGWQIDQPKQFTGLFGVLKVVSDTGGSKRTHEAVAALVDALNANGIAAAPKDNINPVPTDKIQISVGIKP